MSYQVHKHEFTSPLECSLQFYDA